MSSSWPDSNRLRFDAGHSLQPPAHAAALQAGTPKEWPELKAATKRTRDYLLSQQHNEGYWVGELEGDSILESEYILLLAYLKQESSETARRCANHIRQLQLPEGGWAIYPGGGIEVSASVKAYFALKLTGLPADDPDMVRARDAIVRAGGVEQVNSFTRYYLALLGVIKYRQCPAVPPELMLIPKWMPFNIYEMSAWSRTILVPLSILWAHHPTRRLPEYMRIDELFVNRPEDLPVTMAASKNVDSLGRKTWINWDRLFRIVDRMIKVCEWLRLKPFRGWGVRRAKQWMLERFAGSDGLGAIFPPIIWSVVALKCLGYEDDSTEVQAALRELEQLQLHQDDNTRLQPCKSPVWDTALTTIALREAGVLPSHEALKKSVAWLLSKEVKRKGDWAQRHADVEPGGWCFEFNNEFYPDVDDTIVVTMALSRCLPGSEDDATASLTTDFLLGDWSPHEADRDASAVVSGKLPESTAVKSLEQAAPSMNAIRRGVRWVLAMQSKNGGWGAFDADNDRDLFTRVPFADHNAMIDPPTADITSRVLEMFADVGIPDVNPAARAAIKFVWEEQAENRSWYGRWGVNYIYGTWQCLVGLSRMGVSPSDQRIRGAVEWLKQAQQPDGGWGESPRSYEEDACHGNGPPTASQTAWALLGLMSAGETASDAVNRGIAWLIESQNADGTWDEPWCTGTGFPKVFYLRYHYYRLYFPLMALGKYQRLRS